ncbi:hypothetical protein ACTWJ8_39770 (plasmid) [Streptomyces sp. SDT5-1]|uniref:hypothetical protein n=1 Tax=Streptomyces sp. SDT5-1 TaxID=3406418 RepID=UPI003FD0A9B7
MTDPTDTADLRAINRFIENEAQEEDCWHILAVVHDRQKTLAAAIRIGDVVEVLDVEPPEFNGTRGRVARIEENRAALTFPPETTEALRREPSPAIRVPDGVTEWTKGGFHLTRLRKAD